MGVIAFRSLVDKRGWFSKNTDSIYWISQLDWLIDIDTAVADGRDSTDASVDRRYRIPVTYDFAVHQAMETRGASSDAHGQSGSGQADGV